MKDQEAELLLGASLESEKKERERIAADLHDGVQGDLNAVCIYLTVLEDVESDLKKQKLIVGIRKGVEDAFESTRLISYKLMPPALEVHGFAVALEDYFEKLRHSTGLAFDLVCKEEDFGFSSTTAYELFRVVQEFTTNMIKYGNISICTVVLYSLDGVVCIDIIDDGTPFDLKSLFATSKGAGIKNINSRLRFIEAELLQRQVETGNHFVITLKK